MRPGIAGGENCFGMFWSGRPIELLKAKWGEGKGGGQSWLLMDGLTGGGDLTYE